MTAPERDEFLARSRVARVATLRDDGFPDVTPLWFAWVGGAVWLSSLIKTQRWKNMERYPRMAVVVDDGDDYAELRGVELHGEARSVGELPRTGEPVAELVAVEATYAAKYEIDPAGLYDGRHGWIRMDVSRELSWDHRKVPTIGLS